MQILEETRQDALIRYGAAGTYFQRRIAPVYLDLVKALTQGSEMTRDSGAAHQLLLDARATVEQLKAAEVRDFFHDECVADLQSRTKNLDSIKGRVAIVYPILLPDRLELLVTLPGGLERHPVQVGAEAVATVADKFLRALQRHGAQDYLGPRRRSCIDGW